MPLVKGTSAENERESILERVMDVVSENEFCPVSNMVNFGRSNELYQINQTRHIQ